MYRFGGAAGQANSAPGLAKSEKQHIQEIVDEKFCIETVIDGPPRLGFVTNFKTVLVTDEEMNERTGFQVYYLEESGLQCKSTILFYPYFYISCERNLEKEIAFFLEKKFDKKIVSAEVIEKIDIEQINHLSGKRKKYIKVQFKTVNDLMHVRSQLKPKIEKKKQLDSSSLSLYNQSLNSMMTGAQVDFHKTDLLEYISDIREYDVPYHTRVSIDKNIRVAKWYKITYKDNYIDTIECMENIVEKPDLKYLSFDIETSKAELRFPDAKIDQVMMISLMYEGDAYLIVNRDFCGQDVVGFDYAPKPEFECSVQVFNEPTEKACIQKFFDLIVDYKPLVITSFNGDTFDWPFIHERCRQLGLSLEREIGLYLEEGPEYYGKYLTHLDCLYWVIRDAYLPQGSHGLKAVTRAKLGYEPIEVDPELMVPLARKNTQELAEYSISDAVATYFIYKKHIHDFIFALCTIIPCFEDEVLRKGSGTLCENLLMTEAFNRGIIFPNKKMEEKEKMYKGHWLDSETYIGGKVECLRSGVFRSDILTKFTFEKGAFNTLIQNIDKLLEFVVKIEMNKSVSDVDDYQGLKQQIVDKLLLLQNVPNPQSHEAYPLIYHLDVAAMYPNIILTNRLQPVAIVNEQTCSGCLFNSPENQCKRPLDWQWRGEYFPLNRNEFENIKSNLEYEIASSAQDSGKQVWESNTTEEFYKSLKQRVKAYSQKTYKTIHVKETTLKQNTVCMRENSFYIDTVRAFRDRRYTFKGLVKVWKGKAEEAGKKGNAEAKKEASNMEALYESMQLAHKIILNSFYGYVMRKGARWYSMEMAAMVTHIGSSIISDAKAFVDCVGKPLELDTDGIWCLLPEGFPEDFNIKWKDGKKAKMDYPCSILNYLVYEKYSNPQYQNIDTSGKNKYITNLEMSIFFELDGPYRAMIIPAAREEGKLLKKRYVVYHKSGKLAELKGFEIKRRGELNIIKIFQSEIFSQFLEGKTLVECYEATAKVAKKWLNLLKNKGEGLNETQLIEYIGESKVLSKELTEYGEQKGVGITCAKRLKELLGPDIVKGKSLCCKYLMSRKPQEATKAERSIPIQIFNSEPSIKKKFLRKWLKDNSLDDKQLEMKEILDWDYYIERLSNTIQKIIIIPAATQGIFNMLPDVTVPDWLTKQIREQEDKFQQQKLQGYFKIKSSSLPSASSSIMQQLTAPTPMKSVGDNNKDNIQNGKNSMQKKVISTISTSSVQKKDAFSKPKKFVNPYNMNTQFKLFLKSQKEHWIQLKKQLSEATYAASLSTLRQMFSHQDDFVIKSDWHVLQVSPTDQLGIYKLWIFVIDTQQITSVNLEIPRVIYVNSITEYQLEDQSKQQSFKLVKKRLPREKKAYYLYEISKSEQEIHEEFKNFDYLQTNSSIENIYEDNVPLDFKFIQQVGNIVKVNHKSVGKNISYSNYVFKLDQLIGQFGTDHKYLDLFDIQSQFIYIAELKLANKRMWTIFSPITHEYIIVLVHKSIDKIKYFNLIKENIPSNYVVPQLKVQTYNFDVNEKALLFIETYLNELKSKKIHCVVVISSGLSLQNLRTLGVKSINVEFPCIKLPIVKLDESQFSSLDWQKKGIKHICSQFARVPQELEYAQQISSQVQVPICNLQFDDPYNYLTDVIFSRLLKQSNCISWYDEYSQARQQDLRQLIPSDFLRGEICFGGLYTGYTVEIDIGLLTLNTIAHADELKNIDKEASKLIEVSSTSNNDNKKKYNKSQNQDANKAEYLNEDTDELTQAKASFTILQTMVRAWISDVQEYDNQLSNIFIANIHQWIINRDSHFYDPILSKMLLKLSKKIFQYFISKLSQLGAKIVYASLNNIILDTSKHTLQEAQNYTQYLLSTVLAQPMFKVLTLTPNRYFKILLFKDYHNYTALQHSSYEDQTNQDNDNADTQQNENEIEIPMDKATLVAQQGNNQTKKQSQQSQQQDINEQSDQIIVQEWHISEFLPPKLKKYYKIIILEYLYKILMHKEQLLSTPDILNTLQEELEQFSQNYVQQVLNDKLLDAIPELESQQRRDRIQLDKISKIKAEYINRESQLIEEIKQSEEQELLDRENANDFDREADYQDKLLQEKEETRLRKKLIEKKKNQKKQQSQQHYGGQYEDEIEEEEEFEDDDDGFVVSDGESNMRNEEDGYESNNSELQEEEEMNEKIKNEELYRINKEIKQCAKRYTELENEWKFPVIRGSRIEYSNQILEFINFLCHTLNLDSSIKEQLILLKRSSLKLLKINDFSQEAEYKEPCMIIKLQEVVCKSCLHVGELDIFRDRMECPECNYQFEESYIQYKLCQLVKDQLLFYQFQDVYCVKCKIIQSDLLSSHCSCSGARSLQIDPFLTPIIAQDTKRAQDSLMKLAQEKQFTILAQLIKQQWIL